MFLSPPFSRPDSPESLVGLSTPLDSSSDPLDAPSDPLAGPKNLCFPPRHIRLSACLTDPLTYYLGKNSMFPQQGRTAAFCLGASSCHLQSDNKMSPTNLKANFCTFLSILYKTAGKLVVFFLRFVCWWAICINVSSDHSQISCFSCSFLIKFSKT